MKAATNVKLLQDFTPSNLQRDSGHSYCTTNSVVPLLIHFILYLVTVVKGKREVMIYTEKICLNCEMVNDWGSVFLLQLYILNMAPNKQNTPSGVTEINKLFCRDRFIDVSLW